MSTKSFHNAKQRHHCSLLASSLAYLHINGGLFSLLALLKMDVLQKILTLVKEHKDGIPVNKLYMFYNQRYHSNLSCNDFNCNSVLSMISAIDDLVVKDNLVFHKDCCHQSQTGAGASASTQEDARKTDVLKNVVALILKHPNGLRLKDVATIYSQIYRQDLSLVSLGFETISCLVKSLDKDLVVKRKKVFHKKCLPKNQPGACKSTNVKEDSRPGTAHTPEPLVRNSSPSAHISVLQDAGPHSKLGPPLIASSSGLSAQCVPGNLLVLPVKELTQDQLYQRVLEVSFCTMCHCMFIFSGVSEQHILL